MRASPTTNFLVSDNRLRFCPVSSSGRMRGNRSTSERYVVRVLRSATSCARRRFPRFHRGLARSISRTAQETQRADDHLGDCLRLAFLVVVLARLQSPFEIDLLPARNILSADFSQAIPGNTTEPFGPVDVVTIAVFERFIHSDGEVCYGLASRCKLEFRVAADVS